MKPIIILLGFLMFFLVTIRAPAQDETRDQQTAVYTVIYNAVPNNYKYPLFGFVNLAQGNHQGLQVGFVNTTLKNFEGLQVGFVNTTLGNSQGAKIGFINTTRQKAEGLRLGYINTTLGDSYGATMGFVNINMENTEGLQLGFVNIAKKELTGAQIGFINVADTISSGVPIGFLSFVEKGGYRAIETSVNELYPLNLAFKIGVPRFYSYLQGSYNSSYSKQFALGFGFGSLISMGNKFYFNPELGNLSPLTSINNNVTNLAANIRYNMSSRFQVATGLSAVWINHQQGKNLYDPPFYSIINHEINNRNRILMGARIALSYSFTELY